MARKLADQRLPVIGYHGTTKGSAALIVRTKDFSRSRKPYDWLGNGAYFFQDAPLRAWVWAKREALKRGEPPAVVRANIDLRDCMDLLDIRFFLWIRDGHKMLRRHKLRRKEPMPTQKRPVLNYKVDDGLLVSSIEPTIQEKGRGNNILDCDVMNYAIGWLKNEKNIRIRSVRAAFFEGYPVYRTSYFYTRNHVQIAVLDGDAISKPLEMDVVELEDLLQSVIHPSRSAARSPG